MKQAREMKRFVSAVSVDYKTIVSPLVAPGRVSSVKEIDVIAEASGKIISSSVTLKKASNFNKGDILFTIYPDEAALALKAKKSQFLNSLANLLPDIGLDFPDEEETFMKFFSSIRLDKPLPDLPEVENEKMKIFLTSRNILSDYYSIEKDELQLSRHIIRAPFNGTYSEVYLEAGTYINTGGRVAHAICTDELELEVPLERFNAQWVKIGDQVEVRSDLRGLEWQGRVVRKSQFVDESTQSQAVFVKVKNNSNMALLSGEYLKTHFPGQSIPNAMEIPRNAVFNTNEVFIIVEDRLQKRNIQIIKKNENTLIFNGLKKNVMLVTQPLINVLEGTLVEIEGQKQGKEPGNEEMKKAGQKGKNSGEPKKNAS